jgi:hypothetical protein
MPSLVVGGDIGDAIASLPILRQLGGGKLTLIPTPHPGAKDWRVGAELLMPLIAVQPYVEEVEWQDHEPVSDYNTAHFRLQGHYSPFVTLAESQARACGIEELDLSPWLYAHESAHSLHQVVFARSLRYRNPKFPWAQAVRKYGSASIFVGLQNEYQDFIRFGIRMEHYRIRNFLDAAELISGCRMLVANQSCFGWIAMGLGKPLIQEGHEKIHDSRCPREGNIYCHDGKLTFP